MKSSEVSASNAVISESRTLLQAYHFIYSHTFFFLFSRCFYTISGQIVVSCLFGANVYLKKHCAFC